MEDGLSIVGLLLAICLALVHMFASRSQWLAAIPRRWWVSFAGGISIAYIFLEVFPELGHAQADIEHSSGLLIDSLKNHIYLLALSGLTLFYGLEKLVESSRLQNRTLTGKTHSKSGIFWIHMTTFAIYNAILGYLLRESENHGLMACFLLFVTLSVHFIVNDVALRTTHLQSYDRLGRWLLAAAILLGWTVGQSVHLNEAIVTAIWAVIAGGVILNVLKEELPKKQESNFGLFVAGAAAYATILLSV